MTSLSNSVIETSNLSKRYNASSTRALGLLNLKVHKGEIFGFLGPNGAGKTTTIRLLLDLIRPTSGHCSILGMDCQESSVKIHQRIGYLPSALNLYPDYNGRKLFNLFRSLRPQQVTDQYLNYLCETLDVDSSKSWGQLSHGNRQKIGLVLALMTRPDLVILDEPTTGLDPIVQHEVLNLLKEARKSGRTIFFSSHVLSEVEQICDRVGIIRQGQLVAVEQIQDLRRRRLQRIHMEFGEHVQHDKFAALPGVSVLRSTDYSIDLEITGNPDTVIKTAAQHRVLVLETEQGSLDEIFMAYYKDSASVSPNKDNPHA